MPASIGYVDELPGTAEVVIVGGGVIGAATAFFAARAGLEPLILERRPALATLTTAASTGAYRLQFDNVEEWRLVRESVALFESFGDATGQDVYDVRLRPQGYLWVTTDVQRAARQRALVDRQRAWGQADVEVLDGQEVRRSFPYISHDVVQARFRAGDGFLDPKQLTLGLALGSGARVATACEVTGVRVSKGRVAGVDTSRGFVSSDTVVVAAGPFSGVVAAAAGVALPVTAVSRHKVVLPDEPAVPAGAPMTIDDDTGAHWRPALSGAYLLYTDPSTPPTPPSDPVVGDPAAAFGLMDPRSPVSVARVAPFWKDVWERAATHWLVQSGQYTMTPDHRPLLGPTPLPGLYVNTGYSGHGIMGSAAGSRHFVDVLTGGIAEADNPFRVQRRFEERELDVL